MTVAVKPGRRRGRLGPHHRDEGEKERQRNEDKSQNAVAHCHDQPEVVDA
jgi:hypothetical protein